MAPPLGCLQCEMFIGSEETGAIDRQEIEELALRVLQRRATRSERAWIESWRRVSPENAQWYRRLAVIWHLTGELEAVSPEPVSHIVPLMPRAVRTWLSWREARRTGAASMADVAPRPPPPAAPANRLLTTHPEEEREA